MAKPKFELTADMVKVEPEPIVEATSKDPQVFPVQHKPSNDQRHEPGIPVYPSSFEISTANHGEYYTAPKTNLSYPPAPPVEQRKEEIESISMKISKDLKRAFHLWCVQRGITMTDAIEAAIKKYLQE